MSESPKKFKTILAMTFTNKAANEMKERILEKLIQLSKKREEMSDEDLNELNYFASDLGLPEDKLIQKSGECLNQILHNYGVFSVMTIDKFTHKVIRTFAKELNLSLDFEVELDIETLRKNVADQLFDQIGRNREITELMVHYADSNLEDDKSWNFKKSLIEFSNELFKEDSLKAIAELKPLNGSDFISARNEIMKEKKLFENSLMKIGQTGRDLILENGLTNDDFAEKKNGILTHFTRLSEGDFKPRKKDKMREMSANQAWGHKASKNPGIVTSISDQLSQLFDQAEYLYDNHYGSYLLKNEFLKSINNISLMNHLLQITEELKAEDNVLLISDFYKKIAEVITSEPVPFIYERLGVRYEHFLLDEFQDTSHLQWINLVPLLHNSLSTGNSNLIVGDGKQAIYRWRNGEVEQFVKLPDEIYNPENIESLKEAESTFKHQGDAISLMDNYRSAKEVVTFNNGYFNWLASIHDSYIQNIYQDGSQNVKKSHAGYVEFFTPDKEERDVHLKHILSVVERSQERGFSSEDICVLVRKKQDGSDVARHLAQAGFKVVSQESLFVSRDLTVKFIYNLIRSIATPKTQNFKKKCVEHFEHLFHQDAEIFELLDSDFNLVQWFKEKDYIILPYQNFHSFYEFVEHLIEVFDLKIDQNVYLQFFLEQVHLFEKKKSNNLHAFIEWFNESGYKESIKSPEGSDAINIMTIHKAKGLQFPIVICAFFDWDPMKLKSEKWIVDNSEKLPAFPLKSSSKTRQTAYAELMEEEDRKQELDHINMIYVAFTRPETALFVTGNVKSRGSLVAKWLKPYLETLSLNGSAEKADDRYSIGTFEPKPFKAKKERSTLHISFMEQRMDKPTLSTKNSDQWDIHDLDEKRAYGTQLHLLLSKLDHIKDYKKTLAHLLQKRLIFTKFQDQMQNDLERLANSSHFCSYFETMSAMNERALIDARGDKHVPDKIVVSQDELLVVDFKTGEAHTTAHNDQLQTYVELIELTTKKKVTGELFYTENMEVVPLIRH